MANIDEIRKSINPKLRFEILERDHFKCQYCGRKAPYVVLEVDHVNPVANGGATVSENLITACYECNRGKSDEILENFGEGLVQLTLMDYDDLAFNIGERANGLWADYSILARMQEFCREKFGRTPQIPVLYGEPDGEVAAGEDGQVVTSPSQQDPDDAVCSLAAEDPESELFTSCPNCPPVDLPPHGVITQPVEPANP